MERISIKEAFKKIDAEITARETEITAYDQEVGDGDHAINLQRGMNSVVKEIDSVIDSPYEIFTFVGKTLMNVVGGTSGAIYGMGFIAGALITKDDQWNFDNLKKMITLAAERISKAGGAKIGDKTLYDVWGNVKDNCNALTNEIVFREKIVEYMNSTKNMKATKGRASYLGNRSIGVVDPGAVTSEIILRYLSYTV